MVDERTSPGARPRPNRLAREQSPYLVQHAYNPVDWYPWGDEAFERARAEDRPIFLSIGYATCHWCHVMEHESFEDDAVAALLNDRFVSIKVDREERPDIDAVYMTVCQLMTKQGGWPLSIVMTPDKHPFFAGTYFPKHGAHGRIGLLELLPRLAGLWDERRADVEASGAAALEAVREIETQGFAAGPGDALDEATLARAYEELAVRFDESQGGFGRAPKFPTPHQLLFLLRWHHRTGDARALEMVEKTLTQMRRGGIFDHVGYGFHRYSTDARWLVPHFEKMLYDQALLLMTYVELWRVTSNPDYRRVAEEVIEYVLRDLRGPEQAFYSAEDADSEGREGAFYVWTGEAFDGAVGTEGDEDIAANARRAFHIADRGNFADESTGLRTGENILHMRESVEELADLMGLEEDTLRSRLEQARQALLAARSKRERPLLDDKILTDWNGLMIAALAKAGRAFENPAIVDAAIAAACFVLENLRDSKGGVLHRYRAGDAAIAGGAADHAYLAWGFLELYTATFDPRWLEEAQVLCETLKERFWDPDGGGVFNAGADQTDVPVRQKDVYDGATPSANAVTWYVFTRLAQLTGSSTWMDRSRVLGAALAAPVSKAPSAHTMSMVALDLVLGPSHEVVIVSPEASAPTLLVALNRGYRPRDAILFKRAGDEDHLRRLVRLAPFVEHHEISGDGAAAAYVCSGFQCQRPTSDASEMLRLLG